MIVRHGYYPLTHPQQRIWYTEKFYQGTSIANIAATYDIKEIVDFDLLERSINKILEKNEGIRLRIIEENGQIMQYISNYEYVKFDYFDFSKRNIEDLYEWEKKQSEQPFNIVNSNLYYIALLKINEYEAGMFIKLHHLITDAWSMILIPNNILDCYNNLKNGNEITKQFPSYIDFIQTEQEYERSKRFASDQEYWNNKFEQLPEPASLKAKDTGIKSSEAKRKTYVISNSITSKVRQYCHDYKTSLFTVFLTILSVYINRVTGNQDIVLGAPVINRTNYKEKETIGMFVSTVPIRIKMDDKSDFNTLVKNITSDWMGMLRHQRYPYELLLKDLRKKHKNKNNLYEILLSYQNGRFDRTMDTYFEGRWHENGNQADSLFIHINDRDGDSNLMIDYDYMTQFFNENDIESIHKCLMNLLEDAINYSGKYIHNLELIPKLDSEYILDIYNNTVMPYCKDKTIQSLFEEQVLKNPDNIAVVFGDKQLTYEQLNEKSNRLARLIRKEGITQDSVVGILLNRSFEMIIGIMAILKAGGCYLPIDPEYPMERINYMLQDSGSKLLLTQDSMLEKVDYSGRVIDMYSSVCEDYDSANIESINTPDNLAYAIYTSGSTGKPKAVMIEHKALVNYIEAVNEIFEYNTNSSVLSVTTMAFDIFVFELFPTLAKGLKLVLANEQQQKIPELLSELIIQEKVEKIFTTPSRMQLLAFGQSNLGCFDTLKEIALGGEIFPQKLLDKLNQITKARIYNLYGPTEATVYTTCKDLTDMKTINIGSPISNYKIYILDKFHNLMPIGVQGEICIGGDSVARGYLNNLDLTNQKFVMNPFQPGERMYKTGDLGRWNANGEIDFIGRMDHQIKIRGYRVELGEIETQLSSYSKIKEAVVIDKDDESGKKYLCAFIVAENEIIVSELKEYLSNKLPSYMIPSSFTRLDTIPLTPNGKLDRKALPQPNLLMREDMGYIPPRNDIDEKLVSVWSKVLNLKEIGINDNFFDIGGDSLTIIEIQVEMLKYGWSFNTQEFYVYNTIRKLSDKIAGFYEDNYQLQLVEEAAISSYMADTGSPVVRYNNGFKYNCILLTGATGFLGIHILKELLTDTESKICCIIRGEDSDDAKRRLLSLLEFYFSQDFYEENYKRIVVIKGDVSQVGFGIDHQIYNDLGKNVDLVIHAAAIVNYFGEYKDFEKTNVIGTKMVADFCMKFDIPFAHISTLGISGNYLVSQEQKITHFSENDFYIGQKYMDNVYIRSKFEAENLLYQKIGEGLKVCILRIGNLTGRHVDGHFQFNAEKNAFYNILRSIIKLEAINKEVLEQRVEFTPVDLCSKAIVTLLNVEGSNNRVYHVCNSNMLTLGSLLKMFSDYGTNIKTMNKEEFSECIKSIINHDVKSKYLAGIVNDLGKNKYLDFGSQINIDSTITLNVLETLGFNWPAIDYTYIVKIINYMKTSGFIG